MSFAKKDYEYVRMQAKKRFDPIRSTMMDCGRWAAPHRIRWLERRTPGERNNHHIVDGTHILALRSYSAGFLEGNTSASRPWFRIESKDPKKNDLFENKAFLQDFTNRCLKVLSSSNFYNAGGQAYEDFGTFNSVCLYVEETDEGLYFHVLEPGQYFVLNNSYGEARTLVREFSLTIKALVDRYGKRGKSGNFKWDNFSQHVKNMYDESLYSEMIDVCVVVRENPHFDPDQPIGGENMQWEEVVYEVGTARGATYADAAASFGAGSFDADGLGARTYLEKNFYKRKPFIVGKSDSGSNYEYGEKGPTLSALGLIKSLNKKAIGKDQALELMLRPPVQGPASIRKSYVATQPNTFIPLSPAEMQMKGLQPVYQVNPGVAPLIQDVTDLRDQVEKMYYADYLLYLSRNPKTRTATETNAVLNEQQLIIGPNLQTLNWTFNIPIVEYVMSYVLDEDPFLPPVPKGLSDEFLHTEFISVFAQAQKAADLPQIERYIQMITAVAGSGAPQALRIWDKVNLDKLADLFEDRLFLPVGLNNPQQMVDAQREQAQAMQQRQQMLEQTLPAMAGAAKDIGLQANQQTA